MSEPLMTVIMSCYNQARFLRQAIDSVLAQRTDFPVRLIITDDNSTADDSCAIIREYAEKYKDMIVPLLHKENGRYLKNVLRAKEITKTEYFTLLDADDYWTDPDYLQQSVSYLSAHHDYTIYSRNVTCRFDDGRMCPFRPHSPTSADFTFDDYFSDAVVITQTTGTVFRNVIFKHGIPESMKNASGTDAERVFEGDYARYVMHLKKGKAHYENRISGVYRIINGSLWSSLQQSEMHAIGARNCFIFDDFFDCRYHDFFVRKSFRELRLALHHVREEILSGIYKTNKNRDRLLSSVSELLAVEKIGVGNRYSSLRLVDVFLDKLLHKFFKRLEKRNGWYPKDGV